MTAEQRIIPVDDQRCGHCLQQIEGYGSRNGTPLCHPDAGMDCYQLVTVYRHPMPCLYCSEANLLLRNQRITR